jgi:uncharacterized protein (TIGR02444 family)
MRETASGDVAAAWDFAVAFYSRPGVREACLALQDRRRADVIVLLALIHRGAAPGEDALRQALAAIRPWQDAAIQPLRSLRRSLKGWSFADSRATDEAESARQAIGAAERAAERAELSAFLHALDAGAAGRDGLAETARSISTYWQVAGLTQDAADRAALAVILAQAFPEQAAHAAHAVEQAFSA